MSAKETKIARTRMSARERHLRSQLNQIISSWGLARGNLSIHERTCGKPNCRCARGEKHAAIYLVASEDGKRRQLFIPKHLEGCARQWTEDYHRVRELLEELSRLHWDKLQQRKV